MAAAAGCDRSEANGARAVASFCYITLSLLVPSIALAPLFRSLVSFGIFDLPFVMTGGGPGGATETVAIYTYRTYLRYLDFGLRQRNGRSSTTGILIFIACWNEFLLALTFVTRDSAKTITASVASLGGASSYDIPWGPIAASVVVSTTPLILLVLTFQRRIIQGLTAGASKG